MRNGVVAIVVALTTVLVLFAGCAGKATTTSSFETATTSSPSSASQAAFSVPAPELQPGHSWLRSMDITGKVSAGPFSFPLDEHGTLGAVILADGYTHKGNPAMVAVDLIGPEGARTLTSMEIAGASLVDTVLLAELSLGDLQFLRDCQTDPAKCPTDLGPFTEGSGSATTAGFDFPLEPGKEWNSSDTPEGFTGTMHFVVTGQSTQKLLGQDVDVVHMNVTGSYVIDQRDGPGRVTGTLDIDGTVDYSPQFKTQTDQRTHEVYRMTYSEGGQATKVDMDARVHLALVAADMTTQEGLDPVDLYDAFGFSGRYLEVAAKPAGAGKVDVTIEATETPLTDVSWTLLAPGGAPVEEGATRTFQLTLGEGVYTLRSEARHEGRLLVEDETEITASGVVAKGPGTPVEVKETVTCDPFVLNLPGGVSQGACPTVEIELGEELVVIRATSRTNTTMPGVSGTLELLDPSGAVAATAEATADGTVTFEPENPLEPGTWQVRFRPEVAVQATVYFHVQAE